MAFNLARCDKCDGEFDAAELKGYKGKTYCPACLKAVKAANRKPCQRCGRKYSPRSLKDGLCRRCRKELAEKATSGTSPGASPEILARLAEQVSSKVENTLEGALQEVQTRVLEFQVGVQDQLARLTHDYLVPIQRRIDHLETRLNQERPNSSRPIAPSSSRSMQGAVPGPHPRHTVKHAARASHDAGREYAARLLADPVPVFLFHAGQYVKLDEFFPSLEGPVHPRPRPLAAPSLAVSRALFERTDLLARAEQWRDAGEASEEEILLPAGASIVDWTRFWAPPTLEEVSRFWFYNSACFRAFLLLAWERILRARGWQPREEGDDGILLARTGRLVLDHALHELARVGHQGPPERVPVFDEMAYGRGQPDPDYAFLATFAFQHHGLAPLSSTRVVDTLFRHAPHLAGVELGRQAREFPPTRDFATFYAWLARPGNSLRGLRDSLRTTSADVLPVPSGTPPDSPTRLLAVYALRRRFIDWLSRDDQRRFTSPHDALFVKFPAATRRGAKTYLPRPSLLCLPAGAAPLVAGLPRAGAFAALQADQLPFQHLTTFLW